MSAKHTQPEALRLADGLADRRDWYEFDPSVWCPQAAAELRRLHEANQELLDALNELCNAGIHSQEMWDSARAAIAKAEGQQ